MTKDDFPGAPPHAYVCEEGWLVVGEQAWTIDEWLSNDPVHKTGRWGRMGRPRKYATVAERRHAEYERSKPAPNRQRAPGPGRGKFVSKYA